MQKSNQPTDWNSDVTIRETTEYDKFKHDDRNREVRKAHVRRLAQSIIDDPRYIRIRPILVSPSFTVIDGQHRLAACKLAEVPVPYIMADLDMEAAPVINQNQENWRLYDFVHYFASQGRVPYQKLMALWEDDSYESGHRTGNFSEFLRITGVTLGSNSNETVRNGTIADFDEKAAAIRLDMVDDIKQALSMKSPRISVIIALLDIFKHDAYDHDKMLAKAAEASHLWQNYADSVSIKRNLEQIYNYRSPNPISLF